MKRLTLSAFFVFLLCATSASAQSTSAAGTWDTTLSTPQGNFNVQLILKQNGEAVTGVVKSQLGETPIEGTATPKEVRLKYTIKFQDNDMIISLSGAIDGASMKGTADYGGMAQGEFNAKRVGEVVGAVAASANVTGAWQFQVETANGTGTPTFNFKQEGEKLTGQYKGQFGEAPLTGTVKDNKIEFTMKVEAQGQALTLTYTGTVEKDGTMKGSVSLGEVGSGTWTGKRQ